MKTFVFQYPNSDLKIYIKGKNEKEARVFFGDGIVSIDKKELVLKIPTGKDLILKDVIYSEDE